MNMDTAIITGCIALLIVTLIFIGAAVYLWRDRP